MDWKKSYFKTPWSSLIRGVDDSDSDDDSDSFDLAVGTSSAHPPPPRSLVYELSGSSFLDASYCLPNGQAVYEVETSTRLLAPVKSYIGRISLDLQPGVDNFSEIAVVHHKTFGPSILEFEGQSVPVNEIFTKGPMLPKEAILRLGRDRIWVLPDGKEVKWRLGSRVCTLMSNDEAQTRMAIFHRRRLGLLPNRPERPASLEIFPAALTESPTSQGDGDGGIVRHDFSDGILTDVQRRIVEQILVSFVYLEKIRLDRERSARSG